MLPVMVLAPLPAAMLPAVTLTPPGAVRLAPLPIVNVPPVPLVEVETAIGPPLKVYVPAVCMNSMELGETQPAATMTLGTPMPLSSKTTLLPLANATAPPENQLVGPPTCQVELPEPVQVR